jgi:hypothetical protein
MKLIILYAQKGNVIRLSVVMCFVFSINSMFSQVFRGEFVSQNCEYIHFVNDTLVNFVLIGGHRGSIATKYQGVGTYKIENGHLTITIGSNNDFLLSLKKMNIDSNCSSDYKKKISGIDKYKIEIMSDDVIKLIGPIIDGYEKMNRQRFFRSFRNYPWKWSFKKQRWYEPRVRELTKTDKSS